jgi:regulator of protease activity HflC (stomatin/prohibitin superfamily)
MANSLSRRAKVLGIAGAIILLLALFIGLFVYLSDVHRTSPGYVGIVIDYGTLSGGKPTVHVVPSDQYVTINPFAGQVFVQYPVAQQSLVMAANSNEGEISGDDSVACQDKSGINVKIDMTVLWQVNPAQAATLYLLRPGDPLTGAFNSDVESTVVRPIARNALTEACASYSWDTLGANKQAIITDTMHIMAPLLTKDGILVEQTFLGEVHYSTQQQTIIDQLTQAQVAAQQAQYDNQKAQYEAQAAITQAQGQAKAIQIINGALANNPSYLNYLEIQKWNGQVPQYYSGSGSSSSSAVTIPFPGAK